MSTPVPTLAERLLAALDAGTSQPLYQQLQRALRDAIDSGFLAADDALPSERQLAAELGVSRITVRKAIDGCRAGAGQPPGSGTRQRASTRTSPSRLVLRRHARVAARRAASGSSARWAR
jgi:DNA-binding transcriptional MocR family regulator